MNCFHISWQRLTVVLLVLLAVCIQQSAFAAETGLNYQTPDRDTTASQGSTSYENATITEDVTWRGTVIVRGYLVVSQQATVRIEPGTVIRFIRSAILRQAPRFVVLGRLHCEGTPERPVLFTSNPGKAAKNDWGGILLLSSEKRNKMNYFSVEGAEIALELRHSTLVLSNGRINLSDKGVFAGDSTLNMESMKITGTSKAIEVLNSELELRNCVFAKNSNGIIANHSTLILASSSISGCLFNGISAADCRVTIRSSEIADNTVGAIFTAGEGQLFLSRFTKNHEKALHLSGARFKVNSSLFSDNLRDAVIVDDGRALFMGNVFTGNKGFNIVNKGTENVSAVQNWWGSNNESAVTSKLHDAARDTRLGKVMVSPWLTQKPKALPF